jgi:hypothetical protein
MLDLKAVEFGNMMDIAEVLHSGVTCGDAQHLVITARFIGHPEHSHGTAGDHYARESGFLNEYEGVEGVTVKTQGVVDEPVIMGIAR